MAGYITVFNNNILCTIHLTLGHKPPLLPHKKGRKLREANYLGCGVYSINKWGWEQGYRGSLTNQCQVPAHAIAANRACFGLLVLPLPSPFLFDVCTCGNVEHCVGTLTNQCQVPATDIAANGA